MQKQSMCFLTCLLSIAYLLSPNLLYGKKCSFGSSKTYSKKSPYAGLGKKSSSNGLIKTRRVSGHGKRTSKGYTYVNPYARSK